MTDPVIDPVIDSRLRWRLDWRLTLLTVLLLPLLLALGSWQLTRAEEKARLEAAQAALVDRAPVAIEATADDTADFTPLQATGRFDNERLFLLDNRIHAGAYGLEVIAPLTTADGAVVLVNRGWIAGDPGRRALPAVPPVGGVVTVTGHLYREPPGVRWVANMTEQRWPQLIQYPAPAELGARLQQPVRPFILRLDAQSPAALEIDWPVVNMAPATHVGYAVQWFALAMVLVIAWLLASTNLWELIRGKR